ncbi:MAG: hypothetical protein QM496_08165 [Verrucomicrobiota bacterium]
MIKHEWRETLPDGDVRYITAKRHGARWQFQTCLKSDDEWTPLDDLPLEDLQQLRVVMWNKYQRKRIPYEHVLEVDAMIEECEAATQEAGADGGSDD